MWPSYVEVSGGLVSTAGNILARMCFSRIRATAVKSATAVMGLKPRNSQTTAGHPLDALLKDKPGIELQPYDDKIRVPSVPSLWCMPGLGGEVSCRRLEYLVRRGSEEAALHRKIQY